MIITCYTQDSIKLQSSCSVLSPSYSRIDACKMQPWTLQFIVLKLLLSCKFIIFIDTNLLIVAKVNNFLFYTLSCRKHKNMKGNCSLWYNSEFPGICPCGTVFKDCQEDPRRRCQIEKVKTWKLLIFSANRFRHKSQTDLESPN
jgi:hypothetical protein